MKRTLFIPMLFAAMLVAGCQDEPAVTNEPVDSTYTPPAGDTVTAYIPIPLAEYLPGTWVIDGTVLAWWSHDEWHWWFENCDGLYPYTDSLVFTSSEVYMSAHDTTTTYTIIDSTTIEMPILATVISTYENSQIYQLDSNRMLIKGYYGRTHPYVLFSFEEWSSLVYLFIRQN